MGDYWALVDLHYPAGSVERKKAATKKKDGSWPVPGVDYVEEFVGPGDKLVHAAPETIKAYLSHGRDVVTDVSPKREADARTKPEKEVAS